MANKKHVEKMKAYTLINLGKSQKEIAAELNVAEKTVGTWVREWKIHDEFKLGVIKKLEGLLSEYCDDKERQSYEIMNVSVAIKNIHQTLFLNPKKPLTLEK